MHHPHLKLIRLDTYFLRNHVIHKETAIVINHGIINPVDPHERRNNLVVSVESKHTKIILNVPGTRRRKLPAINRTFLLAKGMGCNAQEELRQDADEVTSTSSKALCFLR